MSAHYYVHIEAHEGCWEGNRGIAGEKCGPVKAVGCCRTEPQSGMTL